MLDYPARRDGKALPWYGREARFDSGVQLQLRAAVAQQAERPACARRIGVRVVAAAPDCDPSASDAPGIPVFVLA